MREEHVTRSREFESKKCVLLTVTITDINTRVQQWNILELSAAKKKLKQAFM